jgi:Cu-Zn family superoxide dismutase
MSAEHASFREVQLAKSARTLGLVIVLFGLAAGARAQNSVAFADLVDAQGKNVGRATFEVLSPSGVWIDVAVRGLTPGEHGIHLHAVGTCAGPDFTSAAGHFNPDGVRHGMQSAEGAHAGDLPNLVAPRDGTARYRAASFRVTLEPGRASLFDAQGNGRAIVVHAGPDDHRTDPAGNSGARVVCGIIRRG